MPNKGLIYDVGFHRGEDTAFYLRKGFDVVAIEANPLLVREARDRFAEHLAQGSLTLVDCAVTETPGAVRFYVDTNTAWGTIRPEWVARNEKLGSRVKTITVPGVTFESLLGRYGIPYFLKIDIEGADLVCLAALRAFGDRPTYISLESDKRSWAGLRAEFALLRELGYSRFKVVEQGEGVARQRLPYPAKEGRFIQHVFENYSSGAFGDEAPGEWLPEPAAIALYRRVFVRYALCGDQGLLRRSRWLNRVWRRIPGLSAWILHAPWYDTHARR